MWCVVLSTIKHAIIFSSSLSSLLTHYCTVSSWGGRASTPGELRELAAGIIMSHPLRYSAVLLGRPNTDYAAWITREESWGGVWGYLYYYSSLIYTSVWTKLVSKAWFTIWHWRQHCIASIGWHLINYSSIIYCEKEFFLWCSRCQNHNCESGLSRTCIGNGTVCFKPLTCTMYMWIIITYYKYVDIHTRSVVQTYCVWCFDVSP